MIDLLKWEKLPADKWKRPQRKSGGYGHHRLREDVAVHYRAMLDEVHDAGAILTSSGSRRSLRARVTAGRSSTSLHYIGRALDLYAYSGMVNPAMDPYLVTQRPAGRWGVYARAPGGIEQSIPALIWKRGALLRTDRVECRAINLTAIMARHGFIGINRRSGWRTRHGCLEWWHFQCTAGLVVGETTFGDELRRVYPEQQLAGTSPWKYRNRVWGVDWR